MEPVNVNEVSRISAGTTFKGEITTPTDLRVDGTFEGKICSKGRVVVGEKAQIKGDIICQNVDFTGTMHGNFYVKDTLSLKGAARCRRARLSPRRLSRRSSCSIHSSISGETNMFYHLTFLL